MLLQFDRWLIVLVLVAVLALAAVGQVAADDWPHWRGLNRNGLVAEDSGWAGDGWPLGKTAWTTKHGVGSASPIVADGRLYSMGWANGKDTVYCLDATTGQEIWVQTYACPKHGRYAAGDKGLYAGPTATPEYDRQTGFLYTLSTDGHLNCWDTAKTGERIWGADLYDEYGVPQRSKLTKTGLRDYGYTAAPLVYADWLLVEVGDDEGCLMAFDKRTGQREWVSESKDAAGHTGGMVPMEVEGIPCVAILTLSHLLVVRLDEGNEGRTVGAYPWVTDYANSIASPAVQGSYVVVTSGYNQSAMSKLEVTLNGIQEVWKKKHVSKVCSPVIYQDHIYWVWRKATCVDLATGELKWEAGKFGDAGSCIVTADGKLILWADKGTLALAETADASPDAYQELARKDGLFGTHVWPHIAFSNGKLYVGDRDGNLACFVVGNEE